MYVIISYIFHFLQQIFPNYLGQFAKFCGSVWQIFRISN